MEMGAILSLFQEKHWGKCKKKLRAGNKLVLKIFVILIRKKDNETNCQYPSILMLLMDFSVYRYFIQYAFLCTTDNYTLQCIVVLSDVTMNKVIKIPMMIEKNAMIHPTIIYQNLSTYRLIKL